MFCFSHLNTIYNDASAFFYMIFFFTTSVLCQVFSGVSIWIFKKIYIYFIFKKVQFTFLPVKMYKKKSLVRVGVCQVSVNQDSGVLKSCWLFFLRKRRNL